jgi:hypothetical protein
MANRSQIHATCLGYKLTRKHLLSPLKHMLTLLLFALTGPKAVRHYAPLMNSTSKQILGEALHLTKQLLTLLLINSS